MGRKVHPNGFRLGIIKDWKSKWFAERNYTEQLHQDLALRKYIEGADELKNAGVALVDIERSANRVEVTIHTAKPGIVIGKRGANVDTLKNQIEKLTGKKVRLNIQEIHQPELNAYLVAESVAEQISKRVSHKRAMKQATQRAMRLGAQGIKVKCSGRLGGAEMSRSLWEREGRVPLHTIRADIDYALVHAHTTYGRIGVKVWIYKGDVLGQRERQSATAAADASKTNTRSGKGS
ncbi:30S ribosomal protein S3 [Herpetosiphon gulosus]|uniref:Small ribosomal subunit protein uS3 n=1 Tax=Herpetosiphon gulosus TaxID=1973496 RepID=A0ABP9WUR8_9CHLR